jgi:hypothetical protein
MLFAMLAGTIVRLIRIPLPVLSPAMIRLLPSLVLLAATQVSAGETFTATVIEVTNKKTPPIRSLEPGAEFFGVEWPTFPRMPARYPKFCKVVTMSGTSSLAFMNPMAPERWL